LSFADRAIRSTAWVAAGTYLKAPLNLLANIILMRLIAPEHFGVLAMAMFFLTLGRKAVGFGFNHALVHRQTDLDRVAPTHLALYTSTGLLVFLLALIFKPIVATHYGPGAATAMLLLALFGVAEYAGETPRILMEKDLRFPSLVKLDVANVFLSNLIAVIAALFGAGLWALIAKQIAAWLIQTAGAWRLCPPMPGRRPSLETAKWFFRFGKPMWLAGIATFISLRFDDFLVGSIVSAESLGYYARAYALATFPTVMVTHIVGRVAFPVYAKYQHDRERLSEAFSRVLRLIVTVTAPMGVGLAVVAPELIPWVFGRTWAPMVPLIRLLLVYACLRPIYDDCGELFTAVGRPEVSSKILILQAVIVLVLCPPMAWLYGASGAAVAVGISMLIGVVRAYQMVPRYVNFQYWSIFAPASAACAAATAVTYAAASAAAPAGTVGILFFKGGVFAAVYALVLVLADGKNLLRDFQRIRRASPEGG
jgi:lipopolysaccharide exporter